MPIFKAKLSSPLILSNQVLVEVELYDLLSTWEAWVRFRSRPEQCLIILLKFVSHSPTRSHNAL